MNVTLVPTASRAALYDRIAADRGLLPDASDLWDRPPAKPVPCFSCGLRAEPFAEASCWLCCHTGQLDHVLGTAQRHRKAIMARPGGAS